MIHTFNDELEFEKKSHIFFLKNDNGIYLWDIFRYFVWSNIRHPVNGSAVAVRKISIKDIVIKVAKFTLTFWQPLWILFISKKKYDNLFFLASRNQYEGSFIDQNAFDTYKLIADEENLLLETWGRRKYKFYKEPVFHTGHIKHLVDIVYHKNLSASDKSCIHQIFELLCEEFKALSFTERHLEQLLIEFYKDAYLYEKLLKRHSIKRVFLTQNGIQKGFFYATKKLGIPLYEFQHGIIGKAHMAYSYPKISGIEDVIYLPSTYLTLSDYWCKSFYCPMKNVAIGNNYFSKPVNKRINADKILVISADLFGKDLAKILKEAIAAGKIDTDKIIFKLHPNQYFEKNYFIEYFENKVSVLSDEKSVNELLADSKCMITVCSTAAYEALQSRTRVLVYAISMYKEMELLFDDKNLFLFNNIEELEEGLKTELPTDYKEPIFFEKCTSESIKKAIGCHSEIVSESN